MDTAPDVQESAMSDPAKALPFKARKRACSLTDRDHFPCRYRTRPATTYTASPEPSHAFRMPKKQEAETVSLGQIPPAIPADQPPPTGMSDHDYPLVTGLTGPPMTHRSPLREGTGNLILESHRAG